MAFMDKWHFRLSRRIGLYERLADFMENGFPVEATLDAVSSRYGKRKDPRAKILNEWRKKLALGQKFSDAIKNHVPAEERVLISAGEMGSGGLAQGLREAVRMGKSMAKIKSTIINSMLYPAALVATLIGVFLMFSWQVAPVFKTILSVKEWPETAQYLLSVSDFFGHNWWVLLILLIASSFASSYLMPNWTTGGRKIADHFPPFSVYRDYQGSSFLIALSSMMASGVALSESLQRIQERGSPWLRGHVALMQKKLRVSGSDYGKALNTGMIEEEAAGDIEDYSKLSSFEKAIYIIGEKTMEKTILNVQIKMGVIKNVVLAMVAGSIVWMSSTSMMLQSTISENAGKMQTSLQKK
jgi:type II secretory pathway component PulF